MASSDLKSMAKAALEKNKVFFDEAKEKLADLRFYELTLDKFLNGVRLWIENERAFTLTDAGQLDTGDIDALAADMIIQYALFSDVIYG